MTNEQMIQEIQQLKKARNAVIVAHSYQVGEVQEIADMVGDSLALARYCAGTDADTIVFCGVHFMAESAKIMSPEKMVLLPEIDAGCPMADMADATQVREWRKQYPQAAFVCYINSTAEVKAECDICCTSSNAVAVVRSVAQKDIVFLPDQNLARWVAAQVPEKNIIPWPGFCATHHRVKAGEVDRIREAHPDALMLVHPECQEDITAKADFVGSTKQIIDYARESSHTKFIIGTEMGVMHQLEKENPDKTFYLLAPGLVCPNMKRTHLSSVHRALAEQTYQIDLDETLRLQAKKCLDRMLNEVK